MPLCMRMISCVKGEFAVVSCAGCFIVSSPAHIMSCVISILGYIERHSLRGTCFTGTCCSFSYGFKSSSDVAPHLCTGKRKWHEHC
eukprot:scaffold660844_cov60-Prasinocladus_malaysianus.AAC.1